MSIELKIKEKSLAAEARIIRAEEMKCRMTARKLLAKTASLPEGPRPTTEQIEKWQRIAQQRRNIRVSLHEHRIHKVRTITRATHLARGFLKGTPYKAMEQKAYSKPNWDAVEKMIKSYGKGDERSLMQRFSEWKEAA